jgi:hypothetical protein
MDRLIPPLDSNSHALQLVRAIESKNVFRYYEATTFRNPYAGCELYLYRCQTFGFLVEKKEDVYAVVDVLDRNGDVIQDYGVNKKGFDFLRSQLKFKVIDLE